MGKKADFGGYATRNDLQCADGRTIRKDAFKECNGITVPLVWNHQHDDPNNVLGHALLENRPDGVYCYGFFNDSENGQMVKEAVNHKDIDSLSIYANRLKQKGSDVIHGVIREVSLVLAGANPGAHIEMVPDLAHGEDGSEEDAAEIYADEELEHSDDDVPDIKASAKSPLPPKSPAKPAGSSSQDSGDDSVQAIFDTLNDKQKTVVYALMDEVAAEATADAKGSSKSGEGSEEEPKPDAGKEKPADDTKTKAKGGTTMKHNVFDGQSKEDQENTLSHSDIQAIFTEATKKGGSLRDAVHDVALAHGVTNIEYLFPDAKNINSTPGFITRDQAWVANVMNGTHHTPFSRIKSIYASLTEADARAKGYIKGKLKVEEVFGLLKRTTSPTTIYKKQKIDRDDAIDITDFDVVAWIKSEMRLMLNEEIARAILVGDGRLASSDDHINDQCIRPVYSDDDLYAIKADVSYASTATDDDKAKAFIRASISNRKLYKGSGNPTMYITEDMLTACLLLEDKMGRVIYDSIDKLATALRVSAIVSVPVMAGLSRTVGTQVRTLMGIIVNLQDYNVGADKGGEINTFDDFDIDYNAQKYLIETRCSGALVVPYSAIILEGVVASAG